MEMQGDLKRSATITPNSAFLFNPRLARRNDNSSNGKVQLIVAVAMFDDMFAILTMLF